MKGYEKNLRLKAMVVWLCIVGSFAYWFEMDNRQEERHRAMTTASAFFQQVVITRQWNALHGGVYVPVTTYTRPNEYLPIKDRVLTTDNGLMLTKINPAYMTRQIAELAQENNKDIQIHITSLNPIKPQNKATEWEERWLKSFEDGVKEQGEFFEVGNTTLFRYMAPLTLGPECLKCHTEQSDKEGDIRGGISVTFPYSNHDHVQLLFGYGTVAGFGLIFILIGGYLYERKQRLLDATFNSPVPASITDENHRILMANEAYWAMFGPLPENKKSIKCYMHRPGETCHTEFCPLSKIMAGAKTYTYESIKKIAGKPLDFIVNAKPLFDAKGKVIGCVESFQEITERKRMEEALEEANQKLETLSITDGLTGIANRRRFDEVLEKEYVRHARSGAKLSLIMLDIDYFKLFNDCYGHVEGDKCLQRVARVIADCAVRPTDLPARYGGEEFACVLPETDRIGAVTVAEKIHRGIIACAIPHKDSSVAECVTASLGVLTVQCTEGKSAEKVIAKVDNLLYRAKASGRNRVEFEAPDDVELEIKGNLVQLAWQDSFNSGNQLIDSQHKTLFQISNDLLEAILLDRPSTEIYTIITRLFDEVNNHFQDEEKILETAGFPGLSEHVEEHAKLHAKGLELFQKYKESTLTTGEVFQFLVSEVVLQHMLETDRKYFQFIKGQG